ncbi:hypothetical protein J3R74_003941 [Puniceicoccus vermicola]
MLPPRFSGDPSRGAVSAAPIASVPGGTSGKTFRNRKTAQLKLSGYFFG